MSPEELKDYIVQSIDAMQGEDIQVLPVDQLTPTADYFVIATGRSTRHVKAVCDRLCEDLKNCNHPVKHIEGLPESEWILLDYATVIVHIMLCNTRELYALEKLWSIDLVK